MIVDTGGGDLGAESGDNVYLVSNDPTKPGDTLSDPLRLWVAEGESDMSPTFMVGKKRSPRGVCHQFGDCPGQHVF